MTDIEKARSELGAHSICLCKNGEFFTADGRGISPVMGLIADGRDLRGYSAADAVVGKAAAMLFVKAGITAVHGRVMSEAAKDFLESRSVLCSYDVLTDRIINRAGDGICPMEQTVAALSDTEEAYSALKEKLEGMKARG